MLSRHPSTSFLQANTTIWDHDPEMFLSSVASYEGLIYKPIRGQKLRVAHQSQRIGSLGLMRVIWHGAHAQLIDTIHTDQVEVVLFYNDQFCPSTYSGISSHDIAGYITFGSHIQIIDVPLHHHSATIFIPKILFCTLLEECGLDPQTIIQHTIRYFHQRTKSLNILAQHICNTLNNTVHPPTLLEDDLLEWMRDSIFELFVEKKELPIPKAKHICCEAIQLMDQHLEKHIDFNALAHALNISRRTLELSFRRIVNSTPKRYIRGMRLTKIRHIIETEHIPHGELCALARSYGFHHQGRFAQFFNNFYHCTPQRYVQQQRVAQKTIYS